jgi:hypothetical protein
MKRARILMTRFILLLELAIPGIIAGMFGTTGCSKLEGTLPGNVPPRTYLSIDVPDTVNLSTTPYRKILHWWGTDSDGTIDGYLIRWDGDWMPDSGSARVYSDGLTYGFTRATADTFKVPLGGITASRTFIVRAIDDDGLVDPDGVRQTFTLRSEPDSLEWSNRIVRFTETLPAAAFSVKVKDNDGPETVRIYRVWLNSDTLHAIDFEKDPIKYGTDWIVTFALRREDFARSGALPLGRGTVVRDTVHVTAIDEAGTRSPVLSYDWNVRAPMGPYLWLYQLTGGGTNPPTIEPPFFQDAIYSTISADSIETMHMERVADPDFSDPIVVEPLFSLFKGVIWVTGPYLEANDTRMVRNLKIAETGIRDYVGRGGRVILMGTSVLGTGGGLSDQFATEVLGVHSFFFGRIPGTEVLTTDLSLNAETRILFPDQEGRADSLSLARGLVKGEFFQGPFPPNVQGMYHIDRPDSLEGTVDIQTAPAYFGVISSHGSGRIGVVTNAYARMFVPTRFDDANRPPRRLDESRRFFREILAP